MGQGFFMRFMSFLRPNQSTSPNQQQSDIILSSLQTGLPSKRHCYLYMDSSTLLPLFRLIIMQ